MANFNAIGFMGVGFIESVYLSTQAKPSPSIYIRNGCVVLSIF